LTCAGVRRRFKTGDKVRVDMVGGKVFNLSTGGTYKVEPLPDFILTILRAGGLLPHLKRSVGRAGR